MTYYRTKDFMLWYINMVGLASSCCFLYMPDGNQYAEWFDLMMRIIFPLSVILFPVLTINMIFHRTKDGQSC